MNTLNFQNLLLILLLLSSFYGQAQSAYDQIPIQVLEPQSLNTLNASQSKILYNKTKQIVNANGLAAVGSTHFAIYAEYTEVDTETTEMLETIYTTTASITFNLVQGGKELLLFNSATIEVEGTGRSETKATMDAVRNVNPNGRTLKNFLAESKEKMRRYYTEQCQNILFEASKRAKTQQYESALAMLYSVPKESDCYAQAFDQLIATYSLYQDAQCGKWIQNAKTYLANNNYDKALSYLKLVDPTSSCTSEAEYLLSETAQKVDEKERKIWDLLLEKQRAKTHLESQRLATIKDIAKEYYNQPTTNLWIIR